MLQIYWTPKYKLIRVFQRLAHLSQSTPQLLKLQMLWHKTVWRLTIPVYHLLRLWWCLDCSLSLMLCQCICTRWTAVNLFMGWWQGVGRICTCVQRMIFFQVCLSPQMKIRMVLCVVKHTTALSSPTLLLGVLKVTIPLFLVKEKRWSSNPVCRYLPSRHEGTQKHGHKHFGELQSNPHVGTPSCLSNSERMNSRQPIIQENPSEEWRV